ncbi:MAG: phosphoenolpyruvate--protein phosphotransferase [Lentisphaerae bacterium]|nr:phosphoenolpyruvate--protein phosphotransferase [Lentisphaerota bacterium]MBT5605468.1 phosphoenolpyruvate--protein phosphotransferase [Lentisphaerota bacterium]MBT7060101.1 phosphoenolpyruvate--protein phosphotransferase [Lentisphaerota bacterium]MBT7840839.1 phosphoenolpyruvate--protein phosphotransferase [Lentisphaerota bacterium]
MPSEELQVIRRISDIIAKTTDYEEGLRLTVECIAQRLHVDACSIFVYDEEENRLILNATYGLEQEAVHQIRLSMNEGITGYTFRTGESVNTGNKLKHPEYHRFASDRSLQYAALLTVPLIVGGHTIGVLDFEAKEKRKFRPPLVEMAHAIASPLAVFISNAKLVRQLGHAKEKTTPLSLATETLKGKAITDGVVRGRAHLTVGTDLLEAVPLAYANDVEAEKELFKQALDIAREETSQTHEEATAILAEADSAIFYAHILLLEDPTLIQRIQQTLARGFKLQFALKVVAAQFEKELQALDNDFMRERVADIKDVIFRIYEAADSLQGRKSSGKKPGPKTKSILIARELLPSQLLRTPLANIAGIICEQGGTTTHVAILARALRIPTMVGVPGLTRLVMPNDDLILDCSTESCYIRPTAAVVRKFRPALAHHKASVDETHEVSTCELATTTDDAVLRLAGNIALVSELPLLERYGAMGIGLYRTEFMFMIRGTYPSEEEQYHVFRRVAEACGDSSITVRVLDVGGDKPLPYEDFGAEDNPFLGWRGIRFLMTRLQYLEPHLRAILRMTAHGKVDILLPMVANLDELLVMKEHLRQAEDSLKRDGIPFDPAYRLGLMLEVPSALWALPDMLPEIDFVSIGTNDLTQYTFAVDRGNSRVTKWFCQMHPVLLRMIKETCDLVRATPGKRVSLCGEVAGSPLAVPLLMGCGLRFFSMNPWRIPLVRSVIRAVSMSDCQALLEEAVSCRLDAEVTALATTFAKKHGIKGGGLRAQQ